MQISDVIVSKVYADVVPFAATGNLLPDISFYKTLDAAVLLLISIVVTVIIETVTFLALYQAQDRRRVIKLILIMNIITSPIANVLYGILQKQSMNFTLLLMLIESGVVLFEAYFLKRFFSLKFTRSLLYSLVLNVISFFAGMLGTSIAFDLYLMVKSLVFGTEMKSGLGPINTESVVYF